MRSGAALAAAETEFGVVVVSSSSLPTPSSSLIESLVNASFVSEIGASPPPTFGRLPLLLVMSLVSVSYYVASTSPNTEAKGQVSRRFHATFQRAIRPKNEPSGSFRFQTQRSNSSNAFNQPKMSWRRGMRTRLRTATSMVWPAPDCRKIDSFDSITVFHSSSSSMQLISSLNLRMTQGCMSTYYQPWAA